jgi:FXSXX-COOH protein
MDDSERVLPAQLVDLTRIRLDYLAELCRHQPDGDVPADLSVDDRSVLAEALRRIREESQSGITMVVGFENALS